MDLIETWDLCEDINDVMDINNIIDDNNNNNNDNKSCVKIANFIIIKDVKEINNIMDDNINKDNDSIDNKIFF